MDVAAPSLPSDLVDSSDQPESGLIRRAPVCADCHLQVIVELRQQAGYWQGMHERARQREEKLKQDLEKSQAQVRKLERQLFGRKSEKGGGGQKKSESGGSKRPRGQQRGKPGPGRRDTSHLPAQEEVYKLDGCPTCGLPLDVLGTEDSEVIEVEVKAHKRVIRRERGKRRCGCAQPSILTAPGPAKLIPKSRYGISVWVTILLDKYAFLRPTQRLLEDLRTYGVDMAPGTVTGGLKWLFPLFEPLYLGIVDHVLQGTQWHADETSWPVFEPLEGKIGSNWKFWLFESDSAVAFVLDPTRQARVPEEFFDPVEQGVLVVDRFSSYKAMLQVKEGKILLAFCWSHVRRDFLGVAKDWPSEAEWGLSWVDAIGELFHLNELRLEASAQQFAGRDEALRAAVDRMEERFEKELDEPNLHPVRRKPLKSLEKHWEGLTRFVDHPEIPMDNNQAERTLRISAVARKVFYGSYAHWSGILAAMLFSVFATLKRWDVNPRTWLTAYLEHCAKHGGDVPEDTESFLPWNLSEQELQTYTQPLAVSDSS